MAALAIRLARADEHEAVSALALRSKAHWGYDEEFLEACRAELTWTGAECASGHLWVLDDGTGPRGLVEVTGEPPAGVLEALFVDPPLIGTGAGRVLLDHALDRARVRGFHSLDLDSDPAAEGFYARLGAVRVGSSPSGSVPGRELPRMRFTIER